MLDAIKAQLHRMRIYEHEFLIEQRDEITRSLLDDTYGYKKVMNNMKTEFAIVEGITTFRVQLMDNHERFGLPVKVCAVCGRDIDEGEEISLLVNGCVLFPNVWVHDTHITGFNPVFITKYLKNAYDNYLSHARERRIWGRR